MADDNKVIDPVQQLKETAACVAELDRRGVKLNSSVKDDHHKFLPADFVKTGCAFVPAMAAVIRARNCSVGTGSDNSGSSARKKIAF